MAILALPSFSSTISGVSAQGGVPMYEVNIVNGRELGISAPAGLAFLPGDQTFLIWGRNEGPVAFMVNGNVAEPVNFSERVEDPLNIAFDQQSNNLFFLQAQTSELVKIESREPASPDSDHHSPARLNLKSLELGAARGMTFDPLTGQLFILDAPNHRIWVVSPQPDMGFDLEKAGKYGQIQRIHLAFLARKDLRGLAFNPTNGHLYVGSPKEQRIYELSLKGTVISAIDTSPFQLENPSAMLFAPSGDQTDDPLQQSLYLLDTGTVSVQQESLSFKAALGQKSDGRFMEFSLSAPFELPSADTLRPSTLVQMIGTSKDAWAPSSPDPSGIDYWPRTGSLLVVDGEVDEMPDYFTGKNVFLSSLTGELVSTCSTTNLSHTGFSNEPTGIGIDPVNNRFYITDDDRDRLFEVDLGPDGIYCTSDDVLTSINISSLYGIGDAEDVAYGQNRIFIAGGTDAEVYTFSLGADGKLGNDDGPMAHFDTAQWGFNDLEGIGYNWVQGTLFIVSGNKNDKYLGHMTISGDFINAYDLSFMGDAAGMRSDVAYAPGSQSSGVWSIYIVSRGVDNNSDPQENDGLIWEIYIAPYTFSDVPNTYWSWESIERLFTAGVTGGCSTNSLMYCPGQSVKRDQMAIFLLRGKHGSGYTPPPATGEFQDVPPDFWAAAWIEQMAEEGITSGCTVSPKQYCPARPVTRDQMAVFLLRAKYGSNYVPPEANGIFQDVPPNYWAAAWIEQLVAEGITSGCSVNPMLYCPTSPVTRDQMAVFLVRTFNLP